MVENHDLAELLEEAERTGIFQYGNAWLLLDYAPDLGRSIATDLVEHSRRLNSTLLGFEAKPSFRPTSAPYIRTSMTEHTAAEFDFFPVDVAQELLDNADPSYEFDRMFGFDTIVAALVVSLHADEKYGSPFPNATAFQMSIVDVNYEGLTADFTFDAAGDRSNIIYGLFDVGARFLFQKRDIFMITGENGVIVPPSLPPAGFTGGYTTSYPLTPRSCPPGTHLDSFFCAPKLGFLVPITHWMPWGRVAAFGALAIMHVNQRVSDAVDTETVRYLKQAKHWSPKGFKYSAEMLIQDSGYTPTTSLKAYRGIKDDITGMLGCARSAQSVVAATSANIDSIPMLSYWSTSPQLSDVIPGDVVPVRGLTELMVSNDWRNVAVLYCSDSYCAGFLSEFIRYSATKGVRVVAEASFSMGDTESVHAAVDALNAGGAHIILALTFSADVHDIVVHAADVGMIGKGFVWIGTDATGVDAWEASPDPALTRSLLSGFIRVFSPGNSDRKRWEWLVGQYREWMAEGGLPDALEGILDPAVEANITADEMYDIAGYMYDAVWLMALGMADMFPENYTDPSWGQSVYQRMKTKSFSSVSGIVTLDEKGDRAGEFATFKVEQLPYDGGGFEKVGSIVPAGNDRYDYVQIKSLRFLNSNSEPTTESPSDGFQCLGFEYYNASTLDCRECPAGTFLDLLAKECIPCKPGLYQVSPGQGQCLSCAANSYSSRYGSTKCELCPENAITRFRGANASESCICAEGSYRLRDAESTEPCINCPLGGVCDGGPASPYPQQQYWGTPDDPTFFRPCRVPLNCVGGEEFACLDGHEGRLCEKCMPEHFSVGAECIKCPPGAFFVELFAVSCVLIAYSFFGWASNLSPSFGMMLTLLQLMSISATFNLRWPTDLFNIFDKLSIVMLDIDYVRPTCNIEISPTFSVWLQYSLQPIVFFFVIGLHQLSKAYIHRKGKWYRPFVALLFRVGKRVGYKLCDEEEQLEEYLWECLNSFFVFNISSYAVLADNTIKVFLCDEDGYLAGSPDTKCHTVNHYVLMSIGVVAGIVLVICIPLYCLLTIRIHHNKNNLNNSKLLTQLGFMYDCYRVRCYWFEAVHLLETAAFIVVMRALSAQPAAQACLAVMISMFTLSLALFFAPYSLERHTRIEYIGRTSLILFNLSGFLFYMSNFDQSDVDIFLFARKHVEMVKAFVFLQLIVVCAIMLYYVAQEVTDAGRRRNQDMSLFRKVKQADEQEALELSKSQKELQGGKHDSPLFEQDVAITMEDRFKRGGADTDAADESTMEFHKEVMERAMASHDSEPQDIQGSSDLGSYAFMQALRTSERSKWLKVASPEESQAMLLLTEMLERFMRSSSWLSDLSTTPRVVQFRYLVKCFPTLIDYILIAEHAERNRFIGAMETFLQFHQHVVNNKEVDLIAKRLNPKARTSVLHWLMFTADDLRKEFFLKLMSSYSGALGLSVLKTMPDPQRQFGLEDSHMRELETVFQFYDKDNNGSVGTGEFIHVLRMLKVPNVEREAKDIMQRYNIDGEGDIDLREFALLFCAIINLRGLEADQSKTLAQTINKHGGFKNAARAVFQDEEFQEFLQARERRTRIAQRFLERGFEERESKHGEAEDSSPRRRMRSFFRGMAPPRLSVSQGSRMSFSAASPPSSPSSENLEPPVLDAHPV